MILSLVESKQFFHTRHKSKDGLCKVGRLLSVYTSIMHLYLGTFEGFPDQSFGIIIHVAGNVHT